MENTHFTSSVSPDTPQLVKSLRVLSASFFRFKDEERTFRIRKNTLKEGEPTFILQCQEPSWRQIQRYKLLKMDFQLL